MPIYFDLHPAAEVPLRALRQGIADALTRAEDHHHVRQLDIYCAVQGAIYCVFEAPSPDEVRARHAEQGLPCTEVLAAEGIKGELPLKGPAREALDQAIQRDWQTRHHTSNS